MENLNHENKGILDEKYILLNTLGEGGSAKVYLGEEISSHEKYAIKIFKENNKEEYEKELLVLQKIKNKNIIKLISNGNGPKLKHGFKSNNLNYLVLEFAEKGELFYYVSTVKEGFEENISKYIFKEILYGINTLHENGFCHCDIKLDNILLDNDFNIKISDFSFSQEIKGKNGDCKLIDKYGTQGYFPPEYITDKYYNGIKSDIYSLGITLFALVTCSIPFPQKNLLLDAIKLKNYNKKLDSFKQSLKDLNISDEFFDFVFKMIALKSEDRFNNIEEILKDPWLNKNSGNILDVINEFSSREIHVHQAKTIIELNKQIKKDQGKKVIFRCLDEINFFNNNIQIKQYIEENNIFGKKLIVINFNNPLLFMNNILNLIQSEFENVKIQPNSKNLKAIIWFYDDDNNEDFSEFDNFNVEIKILKIEIKLMKMNEKDKYIIQIIKKGGDLNEFNDKIEEITKLISKI